MATLPLPIVPRTVPLSACAPAPRGDRPAWLRVRFPQGPNYTELRTLMREQELHTICEEAMCPNIGECWENRTATFLILGEICTRNCGFCSVTTGRPTGLDLDEPRRLAEAVERIGLRHIVITSVTRDDLPDGGAGIFAETIRRLRERVPGCGIEVLIPDFQGNWSALETVMAARPGEERDELLQVFADLRASDVDVLTVGQYLRPTMKHLPVERYVDPSEFAELKAVAAGLGFRHVESGPLVRSSYHAHEQVPGS